MVTELRFFVAGDPVSQGSMVCRGMQTKRVGYHQIVPSNQRDLLAWRQAVIDVAKWTAQNEQWQPLDCAEARLIFRFERPKGHYRGGRYADQLKADAPRYHETYPDVDKLVRAVFDALTAAEVVTDDKVITTVTAAKRYCQPGQQPGVNIVLSAPMVAQTALIEVTA